MKTLRTLALTVLCAVPAMASAQSAPSSASSVTLYGVIDTGIEYLNNVGANKNSVVKMANLSGTVPSRWGLRGTEDLGGGMKANFVLESGFAPDSGTSNQGGRLFGRQAWVGLSNNQWGQISLGRQYTMLFWAMLDSDILGPNAYGSSSLDSYFPNARADNAIAYKGKFGGFTVGATYSFGRDAVSTTSPSPSANNCAGENPADHKACREWSALLSYETNWWGVHVAYDSLRGGPGAFAGLTSSELKDDRMSTGGYALIGQAKIGAGWVARRNGALAAPRSNLYYAGIAYDITPAWTLSGEAFYLDYRHSDNKAWLGALRASYAFSKRTSAYVTAGYIDNGGTLNLSVDSASSGANPRAGGSQFGSMVGIKHVF